MYSAFGRFLPGTAVPQSWLADRCLVDPMHFHRSGVGPKPLSDQDQERPRRIAAGAVFGWHGTTKTKRPLFPFKAATWAPVWIDLEVTGNIDQTAIEISVDTPDSDDVIGVLPASS